MPDSGRHNQMEAIVKAEFPTVVITSDYRPGSRTRATNSVSYHALGDAIDMSPRMPIFNWLVENYGSTSKEIIYSPAGGRQIHNGKPHMYSGVTRADHFDHIHWATQSLAPGGPVTASTPSASGGSGGNPFIPDQLEALGTFYTYVTDPGVWVRVGIAVAGAALVIIAFITASRR